MGCHESEADALARMHGAASATIETRSETRSGPGAGPAPLVADWMVADLRACTDCHRIHE